MTIPIRVKLLTLLLVLTPSIGWANDFVDLCVAKKLTCIVYIAPDREPSYNFEMKEFNKNIKSEKQAINIINNLDLKENNDK